MKRRMRNRTYGVVGRDEGDLIPYPILQGRGPADRFGEVSIELLRRETECAPLGAAPR